MEKIKHYYQEPSFGCGPASLLIAYKALGMDYNEVTLTLEVGTTKDGTDWGQMFYHACSIGFPVELKNDSTFSELKKDFKKGIIIVAWATDGNQELDPHYSVVSGITDDLIELTDPGLPPKDWPSIMKKEEFVNKWFISTYTRSYMLIKPKRS